MAAANVSLVSSTPRDIASVAERVVVLSDLKEMTAQERVAYYAEVCRSIGLNPATRPFEYITLNGKLTLYARKDATDQLRRLYDVSITRIEKEIISDVLFVTGTAPLPHGRQDSDVGAVSLIGLKGEFLANAYMKAVTKGKRRVTLSICGLGWLDETEVDSIDGAAATRVDHQTGEIVAPPATTPKPASTPTASTKTTTTTMARSADRANGSAAVRAPTQEPTADEATLPDLAWRVVRHQRRRGEELRCDAVGAFGRCPSCLETQTHEGRTYTPAAILKNLRDLYGLPEWATVCVEHRGQWKAAWQGRQSVSDVTATATAPIETTTIETTTTEVLPTDDGSPPPTFEAALFMDKDKDKDEDEMSF